VRPDCGWTGTARWVGKDDGVARAPGGARFRSAHALCRYYRRHGRTNGHVSLTKIGERRLSYKYMIRKQAISVTLERANVTWLKARADATACRSVSELLDRLVTTARLGGHVAARRSVAGTIEIDPADPSLERADAEIRRLFKTSRKRGQPHKMRLSQNRAKISRHA
jgi:hypothetical protein